MQEIAIESTLVDDIRKGNKNVEIRLGQPRFLKIAEGDTLSVREDLWLNGEIIDSFSDALCIVVTQVLYFESFKELFQSIDFKLVTSSAKSADEAIEKFREFYTEEDEEEFGVVALQFELADE